jgi:rhodanese-related sulfurtransferase
MLNAINFLEDHSLKSMQPDQKNFFDEYVIVDVRSAAEAKREHIVGSINIPLDEISEEKLQPYQDKKIIFHCQLGSRTKQAADKLASLPGREKYCLNEGISQWKRCNLETKLDKSAPIEIIRQVQIIAGSLVTLGVILSYLVSPNFVLLSLFVGLGLIFAGVTGFCGMARLLALLPYNKV